MPKLLGGLPPGVFTEEDVALLSSAFEEAWAHLQGCQNLAGEAAEDARDLLGKFIVKLAFEGERNREILKAEGIAYLERKQKAGFPYRH